MGYECYRLPAGFTCSPSAVLVLSSFSAFLHQSTVVGQMGIVKLKMGGWKLPQNHIIVSCFYMIISMLQRENFTKQCGNNTE